MAAVGEMPFLQKALPLNASPSSSAADVEQANANQRGRTSRFRTIASLKILIGIGAKES